MVILLPHSTPLCVCVTESGSLGLGWARSRAVKDRAALGGSCCSARQGQQDGGHLLRFPHPGAVSLGTRLALPSRRPCPGERAPAPDLGTQVQGYVRHPMPMDHAV